MKKLFTLLAALSCFTSLAGSGRVPSVSSVTWIQVSREEITNIVEALIGSLGGSTNGIQMLNGFGTNTVLLGSVRIGSGHIITNLYSIGPENVFFGTNYFNGPLTVRTQHVDRLVGLGSEINIGAADWLTLTSGAAYFSGSSGFVGWGHQLKYQANLFDGNLTTSTTNLQQLADAVDNLVMGQPRHPALTNVTLLQSNRYVGTFVGSAPEGVAAFTGNATGLTNAFGIAAGANITLTTNVAGRLVTIAGSAGSGGITNWTDETSSINLYDWDGIKRIEVLPGADGETRINSGVTGKGVFSQTESSSTWSHSEGGLVASILLDGTDGSITMSGNVVGSGANSLTGIGSMSATGVVSSANFTGGGTGLTNVGGVVNVLDFGAIADDVNDDSWAINAAIQSVTNYVESGTGGHIVVPKGTFYCTNKITLYRGVKLQGAGIEASVLWYPNAISNLVEYVHHGTLNDRQTGLSDLRLFNAYETVTNTGSGIYIDGGNSYFVWPIIKNVRVNVNARDGILLTNCIGGLVEGCDIAYARGDGVLVHGGNSSQTDSTFVSVFGNWSHLNGGVGYRMDSVSYSPMIGNAMDGNLGGGCLITNGCVSVSLYGNGAEINKLFNYKFSGSYESIMSGCNSWSTYESGTINAVVIDNMAGLDINHNYINTETGTNGYAFYFPTANSTGVEIKNYGAASHGLGVINNTNACALYSDLTTGYKFNIPVIPPLKVAFSTNYTVAVADSVLSCTGTNQLITLPNITNNVPIGRTICVLVSSTTGYGSVIVTNANGVQTIRTFDALSETITNGQSLTLINDGSNWR